MPQIDRRQGERTHTAILRREAAHIALINTQLVALAEGRHGLEPAILIAGLKVGSANLRRSQRAIREVASHLDPDRPMELYRPAAGKEPAVGDFVQYENGRVRHIVHLDDDTVQFQGDHAPKDRPSYLQIIADQEVRVLITAREIADPEGDDDLVAGRYLIRLDYKRGATGKDADILARAERAFYAQVSVANPEDFEVTVEVTALLPHDDIVELAR